MAPYTHRYSEALTWASELHRDQLRNRTSIPYVSHLLHVSALVWEDGGDEDQAIAGLLHDSLEDRENTKTTYAELVEMFGKAGGRHRP